MIPEIDLFTAIEMMRNLSKQEKEFSVSYMSYSIDKNQSKGLVTVNRALLRKASKKTDNRYADHMLNIYDVDNDRYIRCWQPLIMHFNGMKTILQ